MTFTEAALEVLRREGKPLHFTKITELAIRENLLDHVGKVPEDTMADQLAAHARLPRTERKLLTVQHGTFALVEWGLDEDPLGSENLVEGPVDDLPLRPRERHPTPLRDLSRRDAGQPRAERERPRRRDEEDRRGRRFPPPAEVAYELLAGAGRALSLVEIASQGAERLLMAEAFVRDTASLRAALQEDNRRRESAGRKPLFAVEDETVTLAAQPEPGERVPLPAVARGPASASELRRAALAALRRRIRESDGPTVEHVAAKLLEKMGFRELKVAKRGREHVIYTGRRRMGISDVRHAIRIVRGGSDAGRRDVTDLRRDLGNYGAQIGIVISAGEANRDARGEASAAGQLPVLLVCGEALAEALAEAGVGCVLVQVPEVDDGFFATAAEAAEKEEAARLARREERERRREGRDDGEEREERGEREGREGRRDRGERGDRGEQGDRDEGGDRSERTERPRREPTIIAEVSMVLPDVTRGEAPRKTGGGSAEVAPAGEAGPSPVPFGLLPAAAADLDPDDDDDDGEDGEDDGPDDGEPGEAGVPATRGEGKEAGEPGQSERRRRRRRRRRRGGRGRGREGGAAAQPGVPGGEGQPAGTQSAGTQSAATPSEVPPPLPPSPEPSASGDGDPGPA